MKTKFKLGNIKIHNSMKPIVISECCDNHFGKIENAIKMVDLSKASGADIVKFQHHLPDEEMLPIVPKSSNFKEPLYEFLKKYALKLEDHVKLISYCKMKKIEYLCTPFSLKAAEELLKIGVKYFKIGSGEMTDIPTLKKISKFKLPMIISTGMCSVDEIQQTYDEVVKINKNLILMNCTSEYPPHYEDINLGFIPIMQKKFSKAYIGHSDHTSNLVTSLGAVALGAKLIEKHVTLNKAKKGPDADVSISFEELTTLVNEIDILSKTLGTNKEVYLKEKPIRKWAFRSIVSTRDIKKNTKILQSMIWSKRPGTGIPAKEMSKVIGKKARRNIPYNKLIKWSDIF